MPRSAHYPHMEKQGRIWHARHDVPRDLRHHYIDERHPDGRRILSKSTGETSAAKAYEVAKPVIDGWKARFIELRNGGKTATEIKAEQLARKYAKARQQDVTEAEYIRLVEVFDFADRASEPLLFVREVALAVLCCIGRSLKQWQSSSCEVDREADPMFASIRKYT